MPEVSAPQPTQLQHDPDGIARLGGWLFAKRTAVPLPLIAALLLLPTQQVSDSVVFVGLLVAMSGELLRMWAVRQIGVISRTRSDRLGPLITSGPFAHVRNPLYVGNILLWAGYTLVFRIVWLLPIVLMFLGCTYHAIVAWEEQLLIERRGDEYRRYMTNVPRWIPCLTAVEGARTDPEFTWAETIFSERGTLIAIVVGFGLLAIKRACGW